MLFAKLALMFAMLGSHAHAGHGPAGLAHFGRLHHGHHHHAGHHHSSPVLISCKKGAGCTIRHVPRRSIP